MGNFYLKYQLKYNKNNLTKTTTIRKKYILDKIYSNQISQNSPRRLFGGPGWQSIWCMYTMKNIGLFCCRISLKNKLCYSQFLCFNILVQCKIKKKLV